MVVDNTPQINDLETIQNQLKKRIIVCGSSAPTALMEVLILQQQLAYQHTQDKKNNQIDGRWYDVVR